MAKTLDDYFENELDTFRDHIQSIDEAILKLLEDRIYTAKAIGTIKELHGLPVYVPEVEKRKVETLSSKCIYPGLVEVIWPVIMCYTRSVE